MAEQEMKLNEEQTMQNVETKKSKGRVFNAIFLSNIVAIPGVNITCDINNEIEVKSVKDAFDAEEQLVVVTSKTFTSEPTQDDFLNVGCLCSIKRIMPQGKNMRVILSGDARVAINSVSTNGEMKVSAEIMEEQNAHSPRSYELMESLRQKLREISLETSMPNQLRVALEDEELSPADFGDCFVYYLVKENREMHCELLATADVEKRLEILYKNAIILLTNVKTKHEIDEKVNENIAKTQKEIFLREQLKVINEELNGDVDEIEDFTQKVKALGMPADLEEKVLKEVNRLGKLPFGSPELGYVRNFIETVLELPWVQKTEDNIDIKQAHKILDDEHYALQEVKERILESLAVIKLTGKVNAQILCLVGPPGVGKTSIAKSIANAMGRKFVQVSLGGVNDESAIRGHRRTYVGAMCGRILAGMKQAGTINPVFLLDEIDKMTSDARGDPASALLEVLDPAQNDHFKDNFLELPYDLSQVMFILTANDLAGIPLPLRDRMEIIQLRPYTEIEKMHIARNYLIPKQEKLAGIPSGTVKIDDDLMKIIINEFTFEGGVRGLERKIAEICRKYAIFTVGGEKYKDINKDNIEDFLGHKRYRTLDIYKGGKVGQVVALAVFGEITGTTMIVEATLCDSKDKGDILLTGRPGEMMKESSKIAYTLLKSRAKDWGISPEKIKDTAVHVSIPSAGNGVEGPSAGITMTTAMVSAFTGIPVREHLGMTGEISLSGRVFPIGGVRDKLIGACRVGIKDCIIPIDNKDDLWDLPEEVKSKLNIHCVETIDEVLKIALQQPLKPLKEQAEKDKSENK